MEFFLPLCSTGMPGRRDSPHHLDKYNVFPVAEDPIFGSKSEYIDTAIGIPLSALAIEVCSFSSSNIPF